MKSEIKEIIKNIKNSNTCAVPNAIMLLKRNYLELENKDSETLYFIADTNEIYLGYLKVYDPMEEREQKEEDNKLVWTSIGTDYKGEISIYGESE